MSTRLIPADTGEEIVKTLLAFDDTTTIKRLRNYLLDVSLRNEKSDLEAKYEINNMKSTISGVVSFLARYQAYLANLETIIAKRDLEQSCFKTKSYSDVETKADDAKDKCSSHASINKSSLSKTQNSTSSSKSRTSSQSGRPVLPGTSKTDCSSSKTSDNCKHSQHTSISSDKISRRNSLNDHVKSKSRLLSSSKSYPPINDQSRRIKKCDKTLQSCRVPGKCGSTNGLMYHLKNIWSFAARKLGRKKPLSCSSCDIATQTVNNTFETASNSSESASNASQESNNVSKNVGDNSPQMPSNGSVKSSDTPESQRKYIESLLKDIRSEQSSIVNDSSLMPSNTFENVSNSSESASNTSQGSNNASKNVSDNSPQMPSNGSVKSRDTPESQRKYVESVLKDIRSEQSSNASQCSCHVSQSTPKYSNHSSTNNSTKSSKVSNACTSDDKPMTAQSQVLPTSPIYSSKETASVSTERAHIWDSAAYNSNLHQTSRRPAKSKRRTLDPHICRTPPQQSGASTPMETNIAQAPKKRKIKDYKIIIHN